MKNKSGSCDVQSKRQHQQQVLSSVHLTANALEMEPWDEVPAEIELYIRSASIRPRDGFSQESLNITLKNEFSADLMTPLSVFIWAASHCAVI